MRATKLGNEANARSQHAGSQLLGDSVGNEHVVDQVHNTVGRANVGSDDAGVVVDGDLAVLNTEVQVVALVQGWHIGTVVDLGTGTGTRGQGHKGCRDETKPTRHSGQEVEDRAHPRSVSGTHLVRVHVAGNDVVGEDSDQQVLVLGLQQVGQEVGVQLAERLVGGRQDSEGTARKRRAETRA